MLPREPGYSATRINVEQRVSRSHCASTPFFCLSLLPPCDSCSPLLFILSWNSNAHGPQAVAPRALLVNTALGEHHAGLVSFSLAFVQRGHDVSILGWSPWRVRWYIRGHHWVLYIPLWIPPRYSHNVSSLCKSVQSRERGTTHRASQITWLSPRPDLSYDRKRKTMLLVTE